MRAFVIVVLLFAGLNVFAVELEGEYVLVSKSRPQVKYFFNFSQQNTFTYWEAAYGAVSGKCIGQYSYKGDYVVTYLSCPDKSGYTQIFDFTGVSELAINQGTEIKFNTSVMGLHKTFSVNFAKTQVLNRFIL